MESLLHDLRGAARTLRRAPAFTASATLALALGSGLALALLTLARTGLTRPPHLSGMVGFETNVAGATAAATVLPEHPLPGGGWTGEVQTIAGIQAEALDVLLWILGGATLLVLAIMCSNLLILLLARASARRRETALRAVVGARRRRILRQLLAEGALLAAVGGGMGLLLTGIGLGLLGATWPEGMPRWLQSGPDAWVATLGLGVPLLTVLLFGLAPALAARGRDLHAALTTGGRATAGAREGGLRNLLVIAAVAASLVLLTGAGLLLRGFHSLQDAREVGLDPRETLTLQLDLAQPAYVEAGERALFYEAVRTRIAAVPGVVDTSVASPGTWVGLGTEDRVRAVCPECSRGSMFLPVTQGIARHHVVSPGFFEAHGVPLLRGREFHPEDLQGAAGVAVINEPFAYQLFPNGEPLGKQIQVGGREGEWYRVVGIVREIRARGIGRGSEPAPALYLSALQHPPRQVGLAVRTSTDSMSLAPAVEAAIHAVDPRQAPYAMMTMEERLAHFAEPLRWFALVFAALAALGVLLAAHGLYGVISYQVARRTREIGIRMALGARVRQVISMILRESLRLTAIGVYIGLIGALSLARLLQVLFHGVRPLDPAVYGGIALLLTAVALLASYLPARRAARVDPVTALQTE